MTTYLFSICHCEVGYLCGRFMDLLWNPSPLVSISMERSVYATDMKFYTYQNCIQRRNHYLWGLITFQNLF